MTPASEPMSTGGQVKNDDGIRYIGRLTLEK